jgi:hypothetical protein
VEANKAVKEGTILLYSLEPYYMLASLKRLAKEKVKDLLAQL